MADRKPVKVLPDGGGDSTGLGEFVAADTVGVADGGTGAVTAGAALTALGASPTAGNSSLTTLGTIGTGVWQGTDVGVAHGGTGLSTVATSAILTGNGTGALTAESSLTFDGTTLNVVGNAGVGIARTDGTLHVHTSTVSGAVAPAAEADDLVIENNGTGGMTIVTPDASPGYFYFGSTTDNNYAGMYAQYNGGAPKLHFTVGSTVYTEIMTLLEGGNVGIGTTSPDVQLEIVDSGASAQSTLTLRTYTDTGAAYAPGFNMHKGRGSVGSQTAVGSGDWLGAIGWQGNATTSGQYQGARIKAVANNAWTTSSVGTYLTFETAPTGSTSMVERMRIADDGATTFLTTTGSGSGMNLQNSHATIPRGLAIQFTGTDAGDDAGYFLYCADTGNVRAIIRPNGDFESATNSYGSTSDAKLKQDITDVRSYWDDFKAVRFRKFRLKKDVERDADAPDQFGVIGQELETVFPRLVKDRIDSETQAVLDADGNATYKMTGKVDEDGNPVFEDVTTTQPKTDADGNPVLDEDGNAVSETITTQQQVQVRALDEDGNSKPITELVDLDTTHKTVKYSILSQIGLKVVQELQARVEALEAA